MPPRFCDCSLIIPTRNRCDILSQTLSRILSISDRNFEIIVCDNGSSDRTLEMASRFPRVRWIALEQNFGCAARNIGAIAARGHLLLMLDDDSWPLDGVITRLVQRFREQLDLGAAVLRVRLASDLPRHDAGGSPGVIFNCGGAVRRSAFVETGGYPIDYEYYVEEYDLCARLWRAGWRIRRQGDLEVHHARTTQNRNNNRMIHLLVRNNIRLWSRYAPPSMREDLIESTIERYQRVAARERALEGFSSGLRVAREWLSAPRRTRAPLNLSQFESLMGLDVAREEIAHWADKHRAKRIGIWSRGKSAELLVDLLKNSGFSIVAVYDEVDRPDLWRGCALRNYSDFKPTDVDGLIIGSLSCGVAEDMRDTVLRERLAVPVLAPVSYGPTPLRQAAISA